MAGTSPVISLDTLLPALVEAQALAQKRKNDGLFSSGLPVGVSASVHQQRTHAGQIAAATAGLIGNTLQANHALGNPLGLPNWLGGMPQPGQFRADPTIMGQAQQGGPMQAPPPMTTGQVLTQPIQPQSSGGGGGSPLSMVNPQTISMFKDLLGAGGSTAAGAAAPAAAGAAGAAAPAAGAAASAAPAVTAGLGAAGAAGAGTAAALGAGAGAAAGGAAAAGGGSLIASLAPLAALLLA